MEGNNDGVLGHGETLLYGKPPQNHALLAESKVHGNQLGNLSQSATARVSLPLAVFSASSAALFAPPAFL